MAVPEGPVAPVRGLITRRGLRALWWAIRLGVALFVFVGALQLMKEAAGSLSILQAGSFLVENAGSTLGLGWLGALLVLSGSPVAASALTLVAAAEDAGGADRFTELQGFTMLTGSRLGAAFVVLVTAVFYALRGGEGERKAPVTCAVFALSATAMIYIPAAFLGAGLLRWGPFQSLDLRLPGQLFDVVDFTYGRILDEASRLHPGLVFLVGLGCLLVAFRLVDTALPSLEEGSIASSRLRLTEHKWPMFGLGSVVALVTMSISVALTILVPLVAKKYVRVNNILPYIMGANITTLGDTMFAAFALGSPGAVRIVLAEVIATTVLTLLVLTFFYSQTLRGMWRFQALATTSRTRLAVFTATLFLIPVTIIAVSGLWGG